MNQNHASKFDLEERLIKFAIQVIDIAESMSFTKAGTHIANQLIRSGTSPALNYGEAQSAESKSDFIHKLKVILKELRQTSISLKIVERTNPPESMNRLQAASDECDQLICIFVKCAQTAQNNKRTREQAR